jgi:hypothetical protein
VSSFAQTTEGAPASSSTLNIELNQVEQHDSTCRLTFMAQNNLDTDLNTVVFETVLITTDGAVERLTLFDFQTLPKGRKRVRQFDLSDLSCAALGQVLFNGPHACSGDKIDATQCQDALLPTTRTNVEVSG